MNDSSETAGLDISHAALAMVDVQNDFCHPEGALAAKGANLSMVPGMMAHLNPLIEVCKRNDIPVIYIRTVHAPATDSKAWMSRLGGNSSSICRPGSWGAKFYRVQPDENDIIVDKHRYSAFIHTQMETVLHALNIQTLILSGITTNVCVESTARDGFMLDYGIVLASDACAATSREEHDMTVKNINRYFGTVTATDRIMKALERVVTKF